MWSLQGKIVTLRSEPRDFKLDPNYLNKIPHNSLILINNKYEQPSTGRERIVPSCATDNKQPRQFTIYFINLQMEPRIKKK